MLMFLFLTSLVWTHLPLQGVKATDDEEETSNVVQFTQLADCPTNFAFQHTRRFKASSEIDCARRCVRDPFCASFSYYTTPTLSDELTCGTASIRATTCAQLQPVEGAKHYQKRGRSSSPWALVLALSKGRVVSGRVRRLVDMATNGARLRVSYRLDKMYPQTVGLYEVDSARVIGDTVEAHVLTFSSLFSFKSSLQWTRLAFNSTGFLHVSVYNQHTMTFTPETLHFFVRDTSSHCRSDFGSPVLLEIASDASLIRGSVEDVEEAIKEGYPVQIVIKADRDRTITSFPMREANITGDSITITSAWISQYTLINRVTDFTQEMVILQSEPVFSMTKISKLDLMDAFKIPEARSEIASVSFFADFCWEKVLEVNKNGENVSGSYSDLAKRVHSGSDVRVVYQCVNSIAFVTIEVDSVSENNTMMMARSTSSFTPITNGVSDLVWREVYTNAIVNEIVLHRRDGTTRLRPCQAHVSWFVNTAERSQLWYRHIDDIRSPESDSNFRDVEYLFQGLMPAVVLKLQGKEVLYYRRLQSVQWVGSLEANSSAVEGLLVGYNYRSFQESELDVTQVYSSHRAIQVAIAVGVTPNPVFRTVSETLPLWIAWYA